MLMGGIGGHFLRNQGCVRLGNPDFGFCNRMLQGGFQPRNPNPDFVDFFFYRSTGKSAKGFAKLFLWTAVFFLLIMRARVRPLFFRTVFQILFRIFLIERLKGNPKAYISAMKSVFGFYVLVFNLLVTLDDKIEEISWKGLQRDS